MEEIFLTTREVAERLGVTTRTVRKMCEDRKIQFRQTTPRNIEISESWLNEYLESVTYKPSKIILKENKNHD